MKQVLTLHDIAVHNDRQPKKIICRLKHDWGEEKMSRVKDRQGVHLCGLQICDRCGRLKISQVIKNRLNRSERRA